MLCSSDRQIVVAIRLFPRITSNKRLIRGSVAYPFNLLLLSGLPQDCEQIAGAISAADSKLRLMHAAEQLRANSIHDTLSTAMRTTTMIDEM